MKTLLAIESSGQTCSVAIIHDEQVFSKNAEGLRAHTQSMMQFIEVLMEEAGVKVADFDAFLFSAGPGSFTGIRLAAAITKSLAYAVDKPVVPVSSMDVKLESFLIENAAFSGHALLICDAKMGEAYTAEYLVEKGSAKKLIDDALQPIESLKLSQVPDIIITDDVSFVENLACKPDAGIAKVDVTAEAVLKVGQTLLANGSRETALSAQVNYLRDKSGWKTTEQQLAEK